MLTSMGHSSNNGSYSNDRNSSFETELGIDPTSGSFFTQEFRKHEDLKEMLDSSKDHLKLEAMKRIIGMIAKGRDASALFPAVVKNVVSKNIEVKKLVYVYLERYAEEQQDLALLSISTFQRALKEPNQLIRAGALRVLSSIRVKMISPIVMLAIKDASADMSPYVRKTAAHAIPKLCSLDSELRPELVTIIQKLLADKTILVIGSAVMAFTEVCPERIDLIHQVYRKLCALLVDVDEWGQVTIVNMLTRYARMQFTDPNANCSNIDDKQFYESGAVVDKTAPTLDPDHRLLLRSAKPLLQSRNAAVVMAVAQLYHHAAPKCENPLAAKALIRLLRSHVEVQSVVLNAISSISAQNKTMFEAYLKSFFVRTSDPTNIKLLKLEILTNLTTDMNVSIILRELQTYISNSDKTFVAATIQAIGRCACSINEVTDSCLNGLVSLLSNRDEAVVAESVIVIKRLLQTQAADPKEIITHMARLLDTITVAQARAAILWLLGEHSQKVPHIAPDVLRKLAKTFADENDIVKLQVINLAVKLYITNPEQTALLCQYIFSLARYDQNYDIRDRVRMLKHFVTDDEDSQSKLVEQSGRIFLVSKPAPLVQSQLKDNEDLQLGSLSHYIKQRANGYEPLPPFPEQALPGDSRNVESISNVEDTTHLKHEKKSLFAMEWDSSEEGSTNNNSESDTTESSESESCLEQGSESDIESTSGEEKNSKQSSSSSSSESNSESIKEEEEEEEEEVEEEKEAKEQEIKGEKHEVDSSRKKKTLINIRPKNKNTAKGESNLDLLLDFRDVETTDMPVLTPSSSALINESNHSKIITQYDIIQAVYTNTQQIELLNKINGNGLSATYRFTRTSHILSPSMITINILFTNHTKDEITDIRIGKKQLGSDMKMHEFSNIARLQPNVTLSATLGIDFNDTIQTVNFEIVCSLGAFNVNIKPKIGELIRPVKMSEKLFIEKQIKLSGMNEYTATVAKFVDKVKETTLEYNNLGVIECENVCLRFAGQTQKTSNLVLITIQENAIIVNCENIVFGSVLLNELIHNLSIS